jgi:aspartate carbamoyltransferase catalytic subunit
MTHILKSQQFSREALEKLFKETDTVREQYGSPHSKRGLMTSLSGKIMFAVFYQPSSRTRFSFCSAAHYLGMTSLWTEDAAQFSSAIKGETLEDTIHVLCQYDPAVIVLRHPEVGSAEKAAAIVNKFGYDVSIINAGDGKGQHPTQALLDLYTIQCEVGRLDNIRVVVAGDLANGRTVRSLVYLLSKYKNVSLVFLSSEELRMCDDIKQHLQEHNIEFLETTDLPSAIDGADILYWTRTQTEYGSKKSDLNLTIGIPEMQLVKPGARLLHPLPRVGEISPEIDDYHRSAYFRQTKNGMFVRMALLKSVCS